MTPDSREEAAGVCPSCGRDEDGRYRGFAAPPRASGGVEPPAAYDGFNEFYELKRERGWDYDEAGRMWSIWGRAWQAALASRAPSPPSSGVTNEAVENAIADALRSTGATGLGINRAAAAVVALYDAPPPSSGGEPGARDGEGCESCGWPRVAHNGPGDGVCPDGIKGPWPEVGRPYAIRPDETNSEALWWRNPFDGKSEKLATFWWPSHPKEWAVDEWWEHLATRIMAALNGDATPMALVPPPVARESGGVESAARAVLAAWDAPMSDASAVAMSNAIDALRRALPPASDAANRKGASSSDPSRPASGSTGCDGASATGTPGAGEAGGRK